MSYTIFQQYAVKRANVHDGGESRFAWRPLKAGVAYPTRFAAMKALIVGLEPSLADAPDAHIRRHWPSVRRLLSVKIDRYQPNQP